MLKSIQQRDLDRNRWIKITMSVILVIICVSMVVTLVPGLVGGAVDTTSPDTIASVDGQAISVVDVQTQLNQLTQGQNVPAMLKGLYAKQVLDQMVFQNALNVEAERLGMTVTPEEQAERIKQILPTAWAGGVWQKDLYTNEVQTRTGMSVQQFEKALRDEMLTNKFRQMVTAGISVGFEEVRAEFQRRNEKVKIEYALIKPSDLASKIQPSDADLNSYYQKNIAKYQVPEKRSAEYALLDMNKLKLGTQPSDADMRAYYNQHIDDYKVQNRVHAEHILFKTVGKTDAEVAEIKKKAEDVLAQAKKGGNFEDLAKKNSEDDASKAKGGDLGWIVEGQTVPEFQKAAFSLPKGSISDLVKTEYGFHIIKVLDHEQAHTKSYEEVRDEIFPVVQQDEVTTKANDISNQMASAVRQSDRQSIADLAKKFNLELGETAPASITEPVGKLGVSAGLHQVLFQQRAGELSDPLQIESGYVIITPKQILPAHQGTLAEVHNQVLSDYQQEKSVELAKQKADELSKRVAGGEAVDKAAKALGLDTKTSDAIARNGSIPDVGTGEQLGAAAFTMKVGETSKPVLIGTNWVVYRVAEHNEPNPDDFAKQAKDIQQQLLNQKQEAAFAAFRTALEDQLRKEGKLTINDAAMKQLSSAS
jgi:peptidyl-prolyl cis-trans isomerase D